MMSFFKKEDKERKKKQLNSSSNTTNSINETNTDSSISDLNPNSGVHFDQDMSRPLSPKLSSSSKSSIDSSNHMANHPAILLPKPKKGILKKFGIVPSLSHQSSSGSSTPKTIAKLANSTIVQAPPQAKSFEVSIPTYSKRNSQFLNDPSSSHLSLSRNESSSTFTLPKLKSIPAYLVVENNCKDDSGIEACLIRCINIPVSKLNRLKLIHSRDFITMNELNQHDLDNYKNIPILIETQDSSLQFYPNDQLISLNDDLVLDKTLNQVKHAVNIILNNLTQSDIVKFNVRTSLECSDLVIKNLSRFALEGETQRKTPNLVFNSSNKLSSSSLSTTSTSSLSSLNGSSPSDKQQDESDLSQVWLTHATGYSSAKIFAKVIHKNSNTSLDSLSSSNQIVKFKIRLDSGVLVEVNEENLEKANPSQFDFCNDLSRLRFINETSLIHCLRQRYLTLKLTHTLIGNQNLVVLKPKARLNQSDYDNQPTYSDSLIGMFKSFKQEDAPPHIYSYAQSVYKNMLANRQDQSIVLMGHSSSGKSANSKFILNYLFKVANNTSLIGNNFNEMKLNAMYCILNAFCCVKTESNPINSNRYLNVFLLEFNHSGQLLSLLLQLITFDPTRLIHQPNTESNFLIFYYLIFGSSATTKADLFLTSDNPTSNLFFHSDKFLNDQTDSHIRFRALFDQLLSSFKLLAFEEHEIKSILAILSSILHLGRADASKSQTQGQRGQFQNVNEAQKAAQLLGISFNQLNDFVFTFLSSHSNGSNSTPNRTKYSHLSNHGSSRVSPDSTGTSSHLSTPQECLQGFCLGLYQECLNLIVNCINRSFKQNYQTQATFNSMLIVDPPGFQNQNQNQNLLTKTGSYSDLICNYLCERLQLMFFQINFINPIEKCAQEGLDVDLVEHIPESPSSLVNWFDKPPPPNSMLNRSSETNSYGLLWLLEEQMLIETKSQKAFIQRLIESDAKQNFISTNLSNNFTIYHQFGHFPVDYNLDSWLDILNKEFLTQRNAITCLQESKKESISSTFLQSIAMSNAAATLTSSMNSSGLNCMDTNGTSSLKRQASVRKMLTLSKRKTFTINFKLQIDSLFDSMRKTKCNFVFCLLASNSNSDDLEIPLIRSQLKAYQILPACRIYRQGYPEYLNLEEFVHRFQMFLSGNDQANRLEATHKQSCLNLIKTFDLDASLFKIGNTQIFFKAGVLSKLDEKRDENIDHFVVKLQANCRQFLARKKFEKKKLQDSAIKCVQKNIRIWFALKKWKWWRLYTNLMPIVNVNNHELLLKQLSDDLDEFKKKNERLLNEKNELKILNNQLENKFMNLQTEYVEEHAANAGTIDLLEVETSERSRLEKELNELRPLYNETVKKLEVIETEMLELRLYTTKKSIEQELEKDDIDGLSVTNSSKSSLSASSAQPKQATQIENLKRENEMLKRQLKQEKENTQMFNMNERNFFELKLKEKDSELLELEKQTATHKRKYQKICEEMQDLERMCDENKVRNRELEKTQSKHDADTNNLRSKYENEKELREKCERERDTAKYEIFSLKSELDTQKLETAYHQEKCERLERDLKEYESAVSNHQSQGSNNVSTDQFLKMKSQIRDLEAKMRDQEEELDEQTFSIQQLEQAKLKLEMQLEKEKQKCTREIAEKESEMDDLRFHTQKKIKSIEMQLEEESELSSSLQREKRDLERKIREISAGSNSKKPFSMNGTSEGGESLHDYAIKLKRHMLKYKTLAIDAQTQLEKLKESIPKQSVLKALKSQLEDSEFSKTNALKTKQLLQVEIDNLQQQVDEANSHKQNLEEQNMHLNRELNNLRSELEEQERDADEILKKYQNHIHNYTLDSHRFIELSNQIDILTIENRILKEKVRELEDKVSYYETSWVDQTELNKIENRTREFESKLEFEVTHKTKIQNQLDRVKQQYENSLNEIEIILSREKKCEDTLRKSQRGNKEILEEFGEIKKRLIDLEESKKRVEQQNEILERELDSSRSEIKINLTRLEAFQNALNTINESEDDDDDDDGEEGEGEDEEYDDGDENGLEFVDDEAYQDADLYEKNTSLRVNSSLRNGGFS